jgi:hypothetical protein
VPVMTTGALLLMAVLYVAAQRFGSGNLSPWVMAIPGMIAWLVAHSEVRGYLTPRIYGNGPMQAGMLLAAVTGGAATGWEVWTAKVGPGATWPWLAMGMIAFTVLWWALLSWAERRENRTSPVEPTGNTIVDTVMPWQRLVSRATSDRIKVTDVKPHRAGVTLVVEPDVFVDDEGVQQDEDITLDEFTGCVSGFATLASREFRRRTGASFPNNCARTEPGRDDSEYLLHVTMRNVFDAHTKFQPAEGPQSIYTPKDLGEYETADRIEIVLPHSHAKIVGHTGSGKSVEANNWIARITECTDALVWIGATDKLIPLIWPWLRSWFAGQSVRPALDYVAGQSIGELLKMLAAAYKLCCDRNTENTDVSKIHCDAQHPAVFVFVEELSHAVEFTDTITTFDGIEADVSMLLMLIARAGRSAGVSIVIMSQTALNSSGGDCYAEIIRNITIRVCLRTLESHDGYRTIPALNNVDTTTIPLYTKIVQPSLEVARAMPGKAPELDGTITIDPIAITNAARRPAGIEPEIDLGPDYRDRWKPERLPQLARAVQKHGLQWRIPTAPSVERPGIVSTEATGTEGGGEVKFGWTAATDAELDALLGRDEGPQRMAGGFRLPNGDKELDRLKELAAELARDYPPVDDEDEGVGEEPAPLPPPLDRIIDWFDEQEEAGTLAPFYLTEQIAAGIGHPNHRVLGIEINRATRLRSRNASREIDPGQRKGWHVADLREVAARYRFGL